MHIFVLEQDLPTESSGTGCAFRTDSVIAAAPRILQREFQNKCFLYFGSCMSVDSTIHQATSHTMAFHIAPWPDSPYLTNNNQFVWQDWELAVNYITKMTQWWPIVFSPMVLLMEPPNDALFTLSVASVNQCYWLKWMKNFNYACLW